jgi:hypothetical protein
MSSWFDSFVFKIKALTNNNINKMLLTYKVSEIKVYWTSFSRALTVLKVVSFKALIFI